MDRNRPLSLRSAHNVVTVRAWLGMLLVVFVACACRGGWPTLTERTLDGRYVLRTIEGKPLPYSQTVEGGVETIHSGFIEFGGDDGIEFRAELHSTFRQADVLEDDAVLRRGVWFQYDDQIRLTYFGYPQSDIARVSRDELALSSNILSHSRGKIVQEDGVTLKCTRGCDWKLVFAK